MEILEILKYILPSLVVFATAYFLIKQFIESEHRNRLIEMKMNNQAINQKFVTPIRLQAYERVILLLERISPSSLILRENIPGMNVKQLQSTLVKAIRDEYEHNLSQQVYISKQAWDLVKTSKDEMVKLINEAAANIESNAPSTELAKAVFEIILQIDKLPVDIAIEVIKNEIQDTF
ncbi:MAG: hypothetical protein WCL51_15200 [Bacteroidota bacterium]